MCRSRDEKGDTAYKQRKKKNTGIGISCISIHDIVVLILTTHKTLMPLCSFTCPGWSYCTHIPPWNHLMNNIGKVLFKITLVSPHFYPDKNSQTRLTFISFSWTMSVCPVLSQSQSVPVVPLKVTTPEATQVWETVMCWLYPLHLHRPPTSLPAQSATSVHTGDRASINQNRVRRLKTLWQVSVF